MTVMKELRFPVSLHRGEDAARAAAKAAEGRCLITRSFDVPVHVAVAVKAVTREREMAR